MRRRFQQNMQDISFTIMTYMPLLSKNILDEMDVEALTAELQSLPRTAEIRRSSQAAPGQEQTALPPSPPPHPQVFPRPDSLDSSVELIRSSDGRSETSSASFLSISPRPEVTQLAESMAEMPPPPPPYAPRSLEASSHSLELQGSSSEASACLVESKARSDSVVSSSVVSSNGDSIVVSAKSLGATDISEISLPWQTDLSAAQQTAPTRSKAELWREVKMLSAPFPSSLFPTSS